MSIETVGSITHVAELQEVDSHRAEMLRLIEMDPNGTLVGAGTPAKMYGTPNTPMQYVPHPDSYADLPEIESTRVTGAEFEELWAQAVDKFPELER